MLLPIDLILKNSFLSTAISLNRKNVNIICINDSTNISVSFLNQKDLHSVENWLFLTQRRDGHFWSADVGASWPERWRSIPSLETKLKSEKNFFLVSATVARMLYRIDILVKKLAQVKGVPGTFWFLFIFSSKQGLRPLG